MRREAGQLSWTRLTSAQKKAADQLQELFYQAVCYRDQSSAPVVSRLDNPIYNPVFFLHGDRGQGKTTLLHSLRAAGTIPKDIFFENVQPPPREVSTINDPLPHYELLQKRLVWLDDLDFDTQPKLGTLLIALLARIEHYFQTFFRGSAEKRSESSRQFAPPFQAAMEELTKTMHSFVASFVDNLDKHASRLDLDSFAYDAIRVEQQRVQFRDQLEEALERASELASALTPKLDRPVFLMVVDDFDLDPTWGPFFLSNLRNIISPHCIVLMSGNIDMLPMVMGLPIIKEFRTATGDNLLLKSFTSIEVAGQVAAGAIRKLIAPSHVVRLEPPDLPQIIGFASEEPTPGSAPEPINIAALLRQIPIDCKTSYTNNDKNYIATCRVDRLADFLCLPDEVTEPYKPHPRYLGQHALFMPLRHLADLHAALCDITRANTSENWFYKFYGLVAEETKRSFTEHLGLTHAVSHLVEETIVSLPGNDWQFYPRDHFWVEAVELPRTCLEGGGSSTIEAQHAEGWRIFADLTPREDLNPMPKPKLPIVSNPAGWLALFHDLTVLQQSTWDENSFALHEKADWVRTSWQQGDRSVYISWPLPEWRSFFELDMFGRAWNTAWMYIRKSDLPSETRTEMVFFYWIAAILLMLQSDVDEATALERMIREFLPPTESRWKELARKLLSLKTEGSPERHSLVRSGRYAVAACLSPVCGAPKDIWNYFFEEIYASLTPDDYRASRLAWFEDTHRKKISDIGITVSVQSRLTQRLIEQRLTPP